MEAKGKITDFRKKAAIGVGRRLFHGVKPKPVRYQNLKLDFHGRLIFSCSISYHADLHMLAGSIPPSPPDKAVLATDYGILKLQAGDFKSQEVRVFTHDF